MGGGGGPIGQIFNTIGAHDAWSAEEDAARANGDWLMEQAAFAHDSTLRELKIQDQEAEQFYGQKQSEYAKSGIDLSGSPLLLLAFTKMQAAEERAAIQAKGDFNYREADLKAKSSYNQADSIRSSGQMQDIGNAIGVGTSAISLGASGGADYKKSKKGG